jgi:hypothetical protein
MTTIATKLHTGAAAFTVAAAAALMPLPAASAAPAVSFSVPTGLGSALGSATCAIPIFDATGCAGGAATVGGVLYLGPNDATPPVRTDILSLNPIPVFLLIPVIGAPLAGWWSSLDIEVCVGGASARVGGYGTVTASLGSGC